MSKPSDPVEPRALPPEHTDRYHADPPELLGRGGMGEVIAVVDRHLGRQVARKELRATVRLGPHPDPVELLGEDLSEQTASHVAGCAKCRVERRLAGLDPGPSHTAPPPDKLVARFVREARLTAQLEHPAIVPVYELGIDARGAPYYTMQRVQGEVLSAAIAAATELPRRLRLLGSYVALCQGVAYAHSRGVVHRDLKPDNVMLGAFGQTVILDWGLARLAEEDTHTPLTHGATRVEDTAHGRVVGTPRYMAPEQARGENQALGPRSDVFSLGAVLFHIIAGTPPFAGLNRQESVLAAARGEVPRLLSTCPQAPTELAAIVDRAMSVHADDRYASAADLADEVEAWRTGHRVGAYAYSPWEVLWRLVVRHRAVVAVATVALAVLASMAIMADIRVRAERDVALDLRDEARASLAEALVGKAEASSDAGRSVEAEVYAAGSLGLSPLPAAWGLLARYRMGWQVGRDAVFEIPGGCLSLAVGPKGEVLCGGSEGAWVLDDSGTATSLLVARTPDVAIGDDGGSYAIVSRGRRVRVFDADTHQQRFAIRTRRTSHVVAMAANAPVLVYGDGADLVFVDARDGTETTRHTFPGRITAAALSSDGTTGAAVVLPGGLQVVRYQDGTLTPTLSRALHVPDSSDLVFSPDGEEILIACPGQDAHVWNTHTGAERLRLDGHTGPVLSVAWRNGYLATGAEDRTAALWDAQTGQLLTRVPVGEGFYAVVALQSDALLVATQDDRLQRWAPTEPRGRRIYQHPGGLTHMAVGTGAGWLGTGGKTDQAQLWATTPGYEDRKLDITPPVRAMTAAPDGSSWVIADSTPKLRVVDPATGAVRVAPTNATVTDLAFVRGGLLVSSVTADVAVWDFDTLRPVGSLPDTQETRAMATNADGSLLALLSRGTEVVLIDTDTQQQVGAIPVSPPPRALALSPDGTLLVLADRGKPTATIWRWRSQEVVAVLDQHRHQIAGLAVSADGARIATGSWDGTVRLWTTSGESLAVMRGHRNHVTSIGFASDDHLVSASLDHRVRAWDLTPLTMDPDLLVEETRRQYGLVVQDGKLSQVD